MIRVNSQNENTQSNEPQLSHMDIVGVYYLIKVPVQTWMFLMYTRSLTFQHKISRKS